MGPCVCLRGTSETRPDSYHKVDEVLAARALLLEHLLRPLAEARAAARRRELDRARVEPRLERALRHVLRREHALALLGPPLVLGAREHPLLVEELVVAARHRLGVRVADGGAERVADRHRGREVGAHHLAARVHRLGVGLADAERHARQLLDAEALLQVERERLLALPLGHRREQPLVPRARRRHLGRDRAARVVARVLARVGERERVRHALPPLRVAVQPARRRRHVGLPLLPPAAHLLLDVERHRLAHRLAPRRRHLGRRLLRAHLVGEAATPPPRAAAAAASSVVTPKTDCWPSYGRRYVLSIRGRFSSAALRGVRGVFGAGGATACSAPALDGVGEIPGVAALTTLHVGVAREGRRADAKADGRRCANSGDVTWAQRVPCEGETP